MSNVRLCKGNRVITVIASQAAGYLKRGYDQIDAEGNIEVYATGGKTVSVGEHNKALEKIKELEKKSKNGSNRREKELEKQLAEAQEKIAELTEEVEVLSNENKRLDSLHKNKK